MLVRKNIFPLVRYVSNHSFIRPNDLPFARAKAGNFRQQSPFLENSFEGDAFFQRNLKRLLLDDVSKLLVLLAKFIDLSIFEILTGLLHC